MAVLFAAGAAVAAAPAPLRERLAAFLGPWYASVPGTRVEVAATREVTVPGFTAWRLERRADVEGKTRGHEESSLALYDPAKDEVFLGEVLHDPDRLRAGKPFDAAADVPNVTASLQEMFGLPARVELGSAPKSGALLPLTVSLREAENAIAVFPGFVSADGATVLLGEFRPVSEPLPRWREKLLAARPGVRLEKGRFVATEFLDFQCERCRRRTPEARRAAAAHGGVLEVRFLPLAKQHEWSFAASEVAAALAAAGPDAYRRFEEAVFARMEGMSAPAARELAADIAEAAGARAAFEAELSSGRARDRVLRDIELAMRIGIHGTPAFVLDGELVPGERGYFESALLLSRGKRGSAPAAAGHPPGGGKP